MPDRVRQDLHEGAVGLLLPILERVVRPVDDVHPSVVVEVDGEEEGGADLLVREVEAGEGSAGGAGIGEVPEGAVAQVLLVADADSGDVAVLVEDVDVAVAVEVAEHHPRIEGARVPDRIWPLRELDCEEAAVGLLRRKGEGRARRDGADAGIEHPRAARPRRADGMRRRRHGRIAQRPREERQELTTLRAARQIACINSHRACGSESRTDLRQDGGVGCQTLRVESVRAELERAGAAVGHEREVRQARQELAIDDLGHLAQTITGGVDHETLGAWTKPVEEPRELGCARIEEDDGRAHAVSPCSARIEIRSPSLRSEAVCQLDRRRSGNSRPHSSPQNSRLRTLRRMLRIV